MSDITYMTAVMLSALNGADIECKYCWQNDTEWSKDSNPAWDWAELDYRVAQENSDDN